MKVTILGCGAAGGVPVISVGWGDCDPGQPRNRRRRPSILVEEGGTAILVDSGPDLRQQLLDAQVRRLDAVFYTHDHADHVHGIDELREINRLMNGPLDVFAEPQVLDSIRGRFGYVFAELDTGKYPIYKPLLIPRPLTAPVEVGGIAVSFFEQDHGWSKSTGFRFGDFAYSTDVVNLPEESFAALAGVKTWIVGCLQFKPHQTHAHLDKVLEWVARVKPERAILTHMGPRMDYDHVRALCPPGVEPGYDGMVIEV
ncbi:MBL fold metallo-hydrolase [Telmatospirillum sp. J64-1]|uniref:MBL fold metallo-hydrolase n=1 Tax=Telmatospirillum sp. J64-1 TaxID=2502183 RepID=UPI00115D9EF9|nr:MBL fold metallo-hydrolase [Telmatospirillum sp. J64-1]